jgi:leucyl/phenylalanyl-tRNA---protein transferase
MGVPLDMKTVLAALGRLRDRGRPMLRLVLKPTRLVPRSQSVLLCLLMEEQDLTAERVILNYAQGLFPLGRGDRVEWMDPPRRAIIPLDRLHVSKELARIVRQQRFTVTFDTRFDEVAHSCADRAETWITPPIRRVYEELHRRGVAHSVEAWQDGALVGGGYGLALGTMFFLESMFFTIPHASKVAFVHLARQLEADGYTVIDCQEETDLWRRFGATVVSAGDFKAGLATALTEQARFRPACYGQRPPDSPVGPQ